ncbi:cytochrome P450 [Rhizoctonia solani]|nr:cytochrome P450 [Rhizoctonia solani]
MPLVRAIVKETLRWRPPIPTGVPHRLEQDDQYDQYFIPKGTIVMCSIWAIHSNPERYEDPDLFKPNCFLDHTSSMSESMIQGYSAKRDHCAFGAGRRSCSSVQITKQDVFIAISRLLWAFGLSAPPGVWVDVD